MTKIYVAQITDDIDYSFSISDYKRLKLDKCKNEKRIKELIQGEKLLIKALNDLQIPFSLPLDIEVNEYGKPRLKSSRIEFSISHSKSFLACAISTNEIGLDIEEFDEKHERLKDKVFSEEEKNKFTHSSDITKIFTIKEAYLKYLGTGLILNLNKLNTRYLRSVEGIDVYAIEDAIIINMLFDNLSVSLSSKDDADVYIKFI